MAEKSQKKRGAARLLDAWIPPAGSGEPVGCIATTYTFSPVFFEEECLGRFLQIHSDANEDGPVYIIEREEKLNELKCVSVLADAHHCRGARNLRWDLLSARVSGSILHAKISLLYWTNLIRVIIGSANLTEDGYRRNQEIYGVIDYQADGDAALALLDDIIACLNRAAAYASPGSESPSPAINRWLAFLRAATEASRGWGSTNQPGGKKSTRVHAILTGPGEDTVFEKLKDIWPEGNPPVEAVVTSPFFDPPDNPNRPTAELWKILRRRGRASVRFNLTAEDIPGESAVFLHAPEEITTDQPKGRSEVETIINRLSESGDSLAAPYRPLHMKSYLFRGTDWLAYIVGSSNFTTKGLGLGKEAGREPNLEANVCYLVSQDGNPTAAKQMLRGVPEGIPIASGIELRWKLKPEEGEDAPEESAVPLLAAFGQAVYGKSQGEGAVQFQFNGNPPVGWVIFRESELIEAFYDEARWVAEGKPPTVRIAWNDAVPPSGFEVSWSDSKGRAWWPVNLATAASLPPPADLRDLPLDALINILSSARPLHQVLAQWFKNRAKDQSPERQLDPFDPRKRVDTSGFLLQKTYRVTNAFKGLRTRLARPAASDDALNWRLRGPVGVEAVSKAISKEARNAQEEAFLLTELALELSRVRPCGGPGFLPVEKIQVELKSLVSELQRQVFARAADAPQSLRVYLECAFKEALS
jgi:hypothetical protein